MHINNGHLTFILLCLVLGASFSLRAQGQWLYGTVRDARTGEPLISATLQGNFDSDVTDLEGAYGLTIQSQADTLTVRYLGYAPYVRYFHSSGFDSLRLDIALTPDSSLLQEVTVSAGRFEKPLGENTVSLDIIKPELLEQSNTTSVDEVLNKVPGFNMVDGQANIRGGSGFSYGAGSRVLMLIDDIPAYQADAGFPNWDDFPIENIAQIEVVKGAASALYGSSALNGVVNMRTAYATDQPRTKASVFYGTYLGPKDEDKKWWTKAPYEFGASLSDARRLGKHDLVTGLYYLDRNSFQRENYDRYGRFNLKWRYQANRRLTIGLGSNFNRGIGQDFFFWQNAQEGAYKGDSSNYSTSDYVRFSIDPYVKLLTKKGDRHELRGRIFDVDNRNNENRSNSSTLYYGEYQYLNFIPSLDALVTMGIVGIHTAVNAELYSDATLTSDNLALFVQLQKKWFDRLTVEAGMRFEKNVVVGPQQVGNQVIEDPKVKESKPVFRLGLNYQLADYTYIRGSWGQGYRYPTIAEKYISTSFGGTIISPNLDLMSETGWSAEMGIKQGFKLGGLQGLFDVAAFWTEYEDMMEFIFTGLIKGFQSQNIGDTRVKGIDASINGRGNLWGLPTTLIAGYTFVDPRFQEFTDAIENSSSVDYNILKYRSKHTAKIDAQVTFGNLDVGLSVQQASRQEAIDAILQIIVPGLADFRQEHKGYTYTNVRLRYHLNKQWTLSGLMNNLFNAEYSERPGLLAAPRNVVFRLDLQL